MRAPRQHLNGFFWQLANELRHPTLARARAERSKPQTALGAVLSPISNLLKAACSQALPNADLYNKYYKLVSTIYSFMFKLVLGINRQTLRTLKVIERFFCSPGRPGVILTRDLN